MPINPFIVLNDVEEDLNLVGQFLDQVIYKRYKYDEGDILQNRQRLRLAKRQLARIEGFNDKAVELAAFAKSLHFDFDREIDMTALNVKEIVTMSDTIDDHLSCFCYLAPKGLSLQKTELHNLAHQSRLLVVRIKDGDFPAYVELLELARNIFEVMREMFNAEIAKDVVYLAGGDLSWEGTAEFLAGRHGLEIHHTVVCAFYYLEGIVERGEYLGDPIPRF